MTKLRSAASQKQVEDLLRLDNQLCFALYAAARTVTQTYQPLLKAMSLTYPQYLVMLVLWQSGTATVGQLGNRLCLDSGTLTPLLKRLEKVGYVTRQRAEHDERSVLISLTPEGKRLRKAAAQVPLSLACKSGLPASEAFALRDRLKALTDRLIGENNAP
jgi:DNA-binding MarR family transcriptional regulator